MNPIFYIIIPNLILNSAHMVVWKIDSYQQNLNLVFVCIHLRASKEYDTPVMWKIDYSLHPGKAPNWGGICCGKGT